MIARGGKQARHAGAVGVEFQRIDQAAGNAAQQHADRLQAAQGLQEQAAVAHREIAALDQRAGQFARQQHVPVPGRIGVTRGQQRRRAARHDPTQHVEAKLDERIDMAEQLRHEEFRHDAPEPPAVLQGVSESIGKPGAVRQHMPRAVGRAYQVGGVELQQLAIRLRLGLAAGPQEPRICVDQCGGQRAVGQQSLRAVQIGEHRLQKLRALRQAGFERDEFRLRQRQRDRVEPPRIGRRARQQARRTLFLHHPLEPPGTLGQHAPAQAGEHAQQAAPLRAQPTLAVHHLVACHGRRLTSHPERRKSSVRGCSRDNASFGSAIGPGVWPNGKKRERRRASASFALTGKCS